MTPTDIAAPETSPADAFLPPVALTPVAVSAPEPPQEIRYWKKVQVNMPFFAGGNRVQFEHLDTNIGVIAVLPGAPNDVVRDALHRAAEARKGGVVEITEAQYNDLKKKLPLTLSAPKRKPMLQVWDRRGPRAKLPASKSAANAAGGTDKTLTTSSTPGSVGSGVAVGGGGAPAGPGAPLNPATRKLVKSPVMRKPKVGDFRSDAVVPAP